MAARYINRKYSSNQGGSRGEAVMSPERSRPPSRASRGPSMVRGYDSRSGSREGSQDLDLLDSRSTSPVPGYYNATTTTYSRSTTPGMGYPPTRGMTTAAAPTSYTSEYIPSRSLRSKSPSPSYTETLCAASRRLRERSIPPPAPPTKVEIKSPPPPPGKPPVAPPRVVASDFYKGKVKSIYEREPLFKDFCRVIPQRYGPINIYNTETVSTLKHDFKDMVEDKMKRRELEDPSVETNYVAKAYAWRDLVIRPREPASKRIFREQSARPRCMSPINTVPKINVYHRSTIN